jgi:hypothetical protein
MDRQYSKKPRGRSHNPARTAEVGKCRDCLRREFGFECGYCLSREAEVGPGDPFGGFQIDHFRPGSRFKNLQHAYRNLIWACTLCNRAKGDAWPSRQEESGGIQFLDPAEDGLGEHLLLRGEKVETVKASLCGEYFIESLRLNAAAHRERRRQRGGLASALQAAMSVLQNLADGNPQVEEIVAVVDELKRLRREIGEAPPWDAPKSCRCSRAVSVVSPG